MEECMEEAVLTTGNERPGQSHLVFVHYENPYTIGFSICVTYTFRFRR